MNYESIIEKAGITEHEAEMSKLSHPLIQHGVDNVILDRFAIKTVMEIEQLGNEAQDADQFAKGLGDSFVAILKAAEVVMNRNPGKHFTYDPIEYLGLEEDTRTPYLRSAAQTPEEYATLVWTNIAWFKLMTTGEEDVETIHSMTVAARIICDATGIDVELMQMATIAMNMRGPAEFEQLLQTIGKYREFLTDRAERDDDAFVQKLDDFVASVSRLESKFKLAMETGE